MEPSDAYSISSTDDDIEIPKEEEKSEAWLENSKRAGGAEESGWRNSDDDIKTPTRCLVWKKTRMKPPGVHEEIRERTPNNSYHSILVVVDGSLPSSSNGNAICCCHQATPGAAAAATEDNQTS